MQCKRCGANLNEGTNYCSVCGEFNPTNPFNNQPANNGYSFQQQMYNGQQYNQQMYNGQQYNQQFAPYNPNASYDSGSIGWGILGFFIPIVGWILFFIWKNSKPNNAKMAGIGGVIGFIVNALIYIYNPDIFNF